MIKTNINTILVGGFIIVVLLMVGLAIYSVNVSQESLQESIGKNSMLLADEMLKRIDSNIYLKIEEIEAFSKDLSLQKTVLESNRVFENLSAAKDEITSPMEEGKISNELTEDTNKKFIDFYEKKYGYGVFKEVFVTNKYGAIVAQTKNTSDYMQNDEECWQITKEKGFYVSDVEYDERVGTYAIGVGVRIDDENGNFIGVIMAVVNIMGIIREAELTTKKYETTEIKLITNDGHLVYSTRAFKILEDVSGKEFFRKIDAESGFFIAEEGKKEKLFSYQRSRGYRDFEGLHWTLLVTHDVDEVLHPSFMLRNNIFLASLVLVIVSIFIVFLTFRLISSSIKEREKAENALRESEQKLKTIIYGSPIPQFVIDKNHNVIYWNNAMKEQSGITADDIVGTNQQWKAFYSKERPCMADLLVDEATDEIPKWYRGKYNKSKLVDGAYETTDFFPTQGDEGKWLYFSTVAIKDSKGNIIGAVETLVDITNRKKAEEALQKAMEQLKELDKMKDEFFSSTAHELRNPLTPVRIQSQILLKSYFGELTEKQKKSVETILRNTNRLIRLTDDIMTISKMKAGVLKFEMSENNIVDIIESSVNNMELLAKAKKISIVKKYPESLPLVNCDRDRINQIVENLIGNAIKFTPENGKITVDAKRTENDIVVSVRDTGIGISKENQEKLFKTFFQVSSKYGGTGLGLSICRNMIDAHHGKIWVESAPGKGSKFIFTLPVIQQ